MSASATASATVAGVDVPTDHYINGERVGSDRTFATISPIDESVLAEVARAGEREADLAVRVAHDAFPEWAALGPAGRAAPPPPPAAPLHPPPQRRPPARGAAPAPRLSSFRP